MKTIRKGVFVTCKSGHVGTDIQDNDLEPMLPSDVVDNSFTDDQDGDIEPMYPQGSIFSDNKVLDKMIDQQYDSFDRYPDAD